MKLIALGDNVIDYYHNTQECFPGGNAVNVAVHAARLGAQAEYLGSLGDDKMAHIVEKALRENGVDISHCPVLQGRTTKVCSYDVVNGERSFIEVITGESWTGPLQIGARELDELKSALIGPEKLLEAGLPDEGIFGLDLCTASMPDSFFSYRRDGICGRQANVIWIA